MSKDKQKEGEQIKSLKGLSDNETIKALNDIMGDNSIFIIDHSNERIVGASDNDIVIKFDEFGECDLDDETLYRIINDKNYKYFISGNMLSYPQLFTNVNDVEEYLYWEYEIELKGGEIKWKRYI